ncbi:MAG: glycosyltransferase family 39 protein [Chloroflexi bacterium]|nr:glycosyltransferase family 39 protein [Chloroflexota bacterium]
MGALAQLLLVADKPWWALPLYLIAAAIFVLAVRHQTVPSLISKPFADSATGAKPWDAERMLGAALAALSLALLAISLWLFPGGPSYTAAWWCYGLSVTLLLLALPTIERRWTALLRRIKSPPHPNLLPPGEKGLSPLPRWERIKPVLSRAEGVRAKPIAPNFVDILLVAFSPRVALPLVALAAILALGLAIRLYDLDGLPPGLWYDEADNLTHAERIRRDPGGTPVFASSTNLPSMFLMPIALAVKVGGIGMTPARFVAVAFGIIGIVAAFLLVRLMFGTLLGLVAAFLTAVMRWEVNWSRIGMHGITAAVFAALTAYLTLRALRSGRASDFGFAGAMLGLGMWFYAPFRLFPLVVILMLAHHYALQRPEARRFLGHVALLAVTALIVAAPVLQSAIVDSEDFFARTDTTSIFSLYSFGGALKQLAGNLGKHALMFHYAGDRNARHNLPGAPMLDGISAMLMALGFAAALARWRSTALFALPFWILLMTLPAVLTLPFEAPQSLRAIAVTPAVVATITLAIGAIWRACLSAPWRHARKAAPVVAAALLGGIAFLNVNTYFGAQARHPEVFAAFSTAETLIARDIVERAPEGYSLWASGELLSSPTISILADRPRLEAIRAPHTIPLSPSLAPGDASIYIEPRERSFYELLIAYYPEAEFREIRAPGGDGALYYQALISREQLEEAQGLLARYTLADGAVIESVQPDTGGFRLPSGIGDTPFDFVWEGALHVTGPGEHTLALEGDADAEVILDGQRIMGANKTSVRIVPAEGLHSLEVRGAAPQGSILRLLWQPPRDALGPIPADNLYHGAVRSIGLVGRIFQGSAEGDTPFAALVMPGLADFHYAPVLQEPSFSVWEGILAVSQNATYRFTLDALGEARLYLDGELVAQHPSAGGASDEATLFLEAGARPIRVEYFSEGSPFDSAQDRPWRFQALWASEGGALQTIPLELLSPAPERMFSVVGEE